MLTYLVAELAPTATSADDWELAPARLMPGAVVPLVAEVATGAAGLGTEADSGSVMSCRKAYSSRVCTQNLMPLRLLAARE